VKEEGALGQPGRLQDVVERCAGEAALKHQQLGRRQDALPRLFALPRHGPELPSANRTVWLVVHQFERLRVR
jgi:hypothetical protein